MQEIIFSKWDFKITNTKVYKLVNFNDIKPLSKFITTELNVDEFIFTRIDSEHLEDIGLLISKSFYITDFLATFRFDVEKNKNSVVEFDNSIREISYEDKLFAQQSLEIVKDEFQLGHLFNDRNLDKTFGKKIYLEWCINNLKSRAKTFVYIYEGKVAGFIQVLERSKNILQIDLICVGSSYQKKGIGNKLINSLLSYSINNNYTEILVGTQETNYKAISLYTRKGFVKYKSEVSLHLKK